MSNILSFFNFSKQFNFLTFNNKNGTSYRNVLCYYSTSKIWYHPVNSKLKLSHKGLTVNVTWGDTGGTTGMQTKRKYKTDVFCWPDSSVCWVTTAAKAWGCPDLLAWQKDASEWRFFSLFNSTLFIINHIESMNREMKAISLNYCGLD